VSQITRPLGIALGVYERVLQVRKIVTT
jgi:hypothetical protein